MCSLTFAPPTELERKWAPDTTLEIATPGHEYRADILMIIH